VVALDALTRYSYFVNSKKINMNITISAVEQKHTYEMNNDDRLKSKKIILKRADNSVKIKVKGDGCILAQTDVAYFVKHIHSNEAFKLEMEISPVSNVDKCSITTLSPCFTYNGPDLQSNMAILEVSLPSGYEADRASLYKLLEEDTTTKVKMFEELEQKIVLYLTKLNSQQICVNFNINENAIVHSRSNSTIKLYDYYKPEYSVLQYYKISEKCKFNNSAIPDIVRNITRNVSSETTKNISKRNVGMNADFVDIDIELEEPEGI
jgi:CD109 antigen